MNRIELKPCPFCGSDDVFCSQGLEGEDYVECWDCGAKVETYNGMEDAVAGWNTRAIDRDRILEIAYDLEDLGIGSDCFPDWNKAVAECIRKAVGE